MNPEVQILKLVEGGQGLGELPDGKKVFVWNALPGEVVRLKLTRNKRSYAEGIAEEIIRSSGDRIMPVDADYLATSPWQIMTFGAENIYKKQITEDIFTQAKVPLPKFELSAAPGGERAAYGYRGKMEFSFWGDEAGLHLALHQRGSHGKHIVQGSALALPTVNTAANRILAQLQKLQFRAGDLKTIVVRSSQSGEATAALFVKSEKIPKLALPEGVKGLRVYYSNPKSPASVPTKLVDDLGDATLTDTLLGKAFTYDVLSFFQVNVPIFERALASIKAHCNQDELTDMYAGVGSIGLSVARRAVTLVELDPASAAMARLNAKRSELKVNIVETPSERALEYISSNKPVIFDPPRAGLHDKVVERVLDQLPPQIVYLSCNPVTHARDLAKLQAKYAIDYFEAFNFFPRTPHIETLAVLRIR